MHELSIVEKIVQTTEQFAEEKDIANVRKVMLRIGKMTGVLPKYVRSYYKDLIVGTRLEGSELDIEVIPGQCFCVTAAVLLTRVKRLIDALNAGILIMRSSRAMN